MRGFVLASCVLVAGCLESTTVECGEGLICPENTVCAPAVPGRDARCVLPEQLDVCQRSAAAVGGECSFTGGTGLCNGGTAGEPCSACICLEPLCGDGFISGAEDCDGDTTQSCTGFGFYDDIAVRCSLTCNFDTSMCERRCGDGVHDADVGEICDGAPPEQTCFDFGYDAGFADCRVGGCSPDFNSCISIGWPRVYSEAAKLNAAFATGSDIYVVGSALGAKNTVVIHHDGNTWRTLVGTTLVDVNRVWAASPTDLYASNSTTTAKLVHYDGAQWTEQAFGPIDALWGTSATDVWVFGGNQLSRGSGQTFTATTVPGLVRAGSVWGSSANDVYVVDDGPATAVLRHYNGASWTTITIPSSTEPYFVTGTSASDVYVGDDAGMFRWNGSVWTRLSTLPTFRIVVRAADDIMTVASYASGKVGLVHFNGVRSSRVRDTVQFPNLVLTGSSAGVFLPESQQISRFGGSAWQTYELLVQSFSGPAPMPIEVASDGVALVLANRPGNVWKFDSLGNNLAFASAMTIDTIGRAGPDIYAAASGASADTTLYRWDTGTQTFVALPNLLTNSKLDAIAGTDANHIFGLANTGIVMRTQQGLWSPPIAGTESKGWVSLWCSSGSRCIASGGFGLSRYTGIWNGTSWTVTQAGASSDAIWGSSDNDVYMTGNSGSLLHYDGTSFSSVFIPGEGDAIQAIGGTSATDVFAGTDSGRLYHFDGTNWSRVREDDLGRIEGMVVTPDFAIIGHLRATSSERLIHRLERPVHW